ncbi:putative GTP-binding protein 6 isoform X1 [Lycorma delicatula]|uniref:putative GTP-binding protein 6 isoform X1 n=1 Tax=Lycorma delicatula TaxID=130591 RepID=UPI003F50D63E
MFEYIYIYIYIYIYTLVIMRNCFYFCKSLKIICTNSCKPSLCSSVCKRLSSNYESNYKMLSNVENIENNFTNNLELEEKDEEETKKYEELVKRMFRTPECGHQVFVIQPYIKWGVGKNHLTNPVYQLNESIALIETLQNWKVVDKEKISLTSFKKTKFFGKGNLSSLKERIAGNKLITGVFLSINLLKRGQHEFLEEFFGVPVYDRYNIVVQIFRQHAVTKEAKLQVALAEIPFMWYRIKDINDRGGGAISSIGGSGETILEVKKRLLTLREQKLKREVKKLEVHRQLLRNKRKEKQYPIIAVVGYTNAGKTSLIKSLTEEDKLKPKNRLFATLDVTMHSGLLPSNIKVLYADTIGFISDIPTELIQPFNVTLEDAIQSDLLVHVLDISNPDVVAQCKHVICTLSRLQVNERLLNNIIHVANKCDIINNESDLSKLGLNINVDDDVKFVMKNMLYISCLKQTGISDLRSKIESALLQITGRIQIRIRIKYGGGEFKWLYKQSSVVRVLSDESDPQFVYMDVIITEE